MEQPSVPSILHKISWEGKVCPQSNDLRQIGRMRLGVLIGSLITVSVITLITAEPFLFNPSLWVTSIQLRWMIDLVLVIHSSFLLTVSVTYSNSFCNLQLAFHGIKISEQSEIQS